MHVFLLWTVKDLLLSRPSFLADHVDSIVKACWLKSNGGKLSVAIGGVLFWLVCLLRVLKAVSGVDLQARLSCENVQLSP